MRQRSRCVGLAACALLLTTTHLAAEEFSPELADVLERLEAAEQRIWELERGDSALVGQFPGSASLAAFQENGETQTNGAAAELDEESFAERLMNIEENWRRFTEERAVQSAAAAGRPSFKIGGRIHLDSWWFPEDSEGIHWFENPDTGVNPENRIFFRRIRFETGGEVLQTMLWKIQVDFNNPQTPELKDVYIGFDELPLNQVALFGIQKRPLGLDHLNSSRFNVFIERPLVVEAFNEDARRLGAAMYGYTDDELYHWRYGVYLLENITTTGRYIGDSTQASFNARLSSSPWYDESSGGRGYFHWAVAGMVARPDGDVDPRDSNENEARFRTRAELRSDLRWIDTGRIRGAEWYEILGLESILNIGALQIVSEYQTNWTQRDERTPGTGPDVFFHGAYVYVAYFLTGEHVPYERVTGTIDRVRPFENFFLVERCRGGCGGGWGAWQVAARYSYLDLTDHDILGGVEHNTTLALNWHWTPYSKLQFNAIYGEIRDREPVAGFTGGHFTALGTRMMIDF